MKNKSKASFVASHLCAIFLIAATSQLLIPSNSFGQTPEKTDTQETKDKWGISEKEWQTLSDFELYLKIVGKVNYNEILSDAKNGDSKAIYLLGVMLEKGRVERKYEAEILKLLRKAADAGDTDAMLYLGLGLAQGQGTKANVAEAVQWFRKSGESGNTKAMVYLGYLLDKGQGIQKNEAEAVQWYRKAAEAGNLQAMILLGSKLEKGQGVTKDETESKKWFIRAASVAGQHSKHSAEYLQNKYGMKCTPNGEAFICKE